MFTCIRTSANERGAMEDAWSSRSEKDCLSQSVLVCKPFRAVAFQDSPQPFFVQHKKRLPPDWIEHLRVANEVLKRFHLILSKSLLPSSGLDLSSPKAYSLGLSAFVCVGLRVACVTVLVTHCNRSQTQSPGMHTFLLKPIRQPNCFAVETTISKGL